MTLITTSVSVRNNVIEKYDFFINNVLHIL